jgi:hypothetical protein
MIVDLDEDDDVSGKRTKRQFLEWLKSLLEQTDESLLNLPDRQFIELQSTERERRLVGVFGHIPFSLKTAEDYQRCAQIVSEATSRVHRCRTNPAELRALLEDAIAHVEKRPAYTREEFYAKKRAFNTIHHIIASNCLAFYHGDLGRTDQGVDKTLIAFTNAVFSSFSIELKTDTIKQMLIRLRKS